jgi:hypothetical protein
MAVEGIYRSRLKEEIEFMWAFQINSETYPAHFGGRNLFDVIEYLIKEDTDWTYSEENSKYLILQKDMIKWKDQ